MSTLKKGFLSLACTALLGVAGQAWAIGLGDLTIRSHLHQPLKADINLIGADNKSLKSVHAGLAPKAEFERFNIQYPSVLNELQFVPTHDKHDNPVVRITSKKPIEQPNFTILFAVDWGDNKLLRKYHVMLYPASGENATPAHPQRQSHTAFNQSTPRTEKRAVNSVASDVQTSSAAATSTKAYEAALNDLDELASTEAPQQAHKSGTHAQEAVAAAPGHTAGEGHRVASIEKDLFQFAKSVAHSTGGNIEQSMVAIYRLNPRAFCHRNMNCLRKGAQFTVPTAEEVLAVKKSDATRIISSHNAAWANRESGQVAEQPLAPVVKPVTNKPQAHKAAPTPQAVVAAPATEDVTPYHHYHNARSDGEHSLPKHPQQQREPKAPAEAAPAAVKPLTHLRGEGGHTVARIQQELVVSRSEINNLRRINRILSKRIDELEGGDDSLEALVSEQQEVLTRLQSHKLAPSVTDEYATQ